MKPEAWLCSDVTPRRKAPGVWTLCWRQRVDPGMHTEAPGVDGAGYKQGQRQRQLTCEGRALDHPKVKTRQNSRTPLRSSQSGSAVMPPARIHEVAGLISGLTQWVKDPASPGAVASVAERSSGLALLWLWCRPVATAPSQPLAWEPPYAGGTALARGNKKDTT